MPFGNFWGYVKGAFTECLTLDVINWTPVGEYDGNEPGEYQFEGEAVAPEGYRFAEGVDTTVTAMVIVFGDPASIEVVNQPADTFAGEIIKSDDNDFPAVEATDDNGNPVPDETIQVTLAGKGWGDPFESGTRFKDTNDAGIATFDDLVIAEPAVYRLAFRLDDDPLGVGTIYSDEFTIFDADKTVHLYDDEDNFVSSYSTIQEAINDANKDYTVKVYPGTYEEGQELTVDVEGLMLKSVEEHEAKVKDRIFIEPGADNVTLQGFEIEANINIGRAGQVGVDGTRIINNVLIGNWSEGGSRRGITLSSSGVPEGDYNVIVKGNEFRNNLTGIYLSSHWSLDISKNVFEDNRTAVAVDTSTEEEIQFTDNQFIGQVSAISIGGNVIEETVLVIEDNDFSGAAPGDRYFTDRRYADEDDVTPVPYIDDVILDNDFDDYEKVWVSESWRIIYPE